MKYLRANLELLNFEEEQFLDNELVIKLLICFNLDQKEVLTWYVQFALS